MKVLDLFSGVGGFSLGLERAGMKTVAFCESDTFCQKVLAKHWPDVPIYKDARVFDGELFDGVDIICGGFPCQPFSTAAAGKNPQDTLSKEFFRIVREASPSYVLAENVSKKAFNNQTIKSLIDMEYRIELRNIKANEIGAPHERSRWWLCAYPYHKSELPSAIDAEMAKLPKLAQSVWGWENYARTIRVSNGVSYRVDRLRAIGNALVPDIPEVIGRAIMQIQDAKEGLK